MGEIVALIIGIVIGVVGRIIYDVVTAKSVKSHSSNTGSGTDYQTDKSNNDVINRQ